MSLLLRFSARIVNEIHGSVRGGSLSLFAGLMLANATAYGYHTIMARMLSPGDYGVLVTLTSISSVFAVFARTLQLWIISAVSSESGANPTDISLVFRAAMRTVLPFGSMILVGHWLGSSVIADFLRLERTSPVVILGVYAFTSFLTPIPRGMLLGLNRLHLAGAIYSLESIARLLAAIIFVSWGLGANGALASYAFGDILAFVIATISLRSFLRGHDCSTQAPNALANLDRYALLVLLANLLLMTLSSIDQIAVKHFFSEHTAGIYAVAFLLGRIVLMSTMALGWIVFSRAANFALNDPRQLRLYAKGLLVTAFIAIFLTIGYVAAPTVAARVMGGNQYTSANAYVGLVAIEMSLFAFVYIQVYYLLALKQMNVVWPLLLAVTAQFILLARYHTTVEHILLNLIIVMSTLLVSVSGLCWYTLRTNRSLVTTGARPTSRPIIEIS